MRIASSIAISLLACQVHAFIPPQSISTATKGTQLQLSLKDELASFSGYDAAKDTRLASKVAEVATPPTTTTDVSSSSLPDLSGIKAAIPDIKVPDINLPDNIGSKISLPDITLPTDIISLPQITSVDEISNQIINTIQSYELLADNQLTTLLGPTYTTIKLSLTPIFNKLIHPDLPPSITLLLASYITYSIVSTILSFGQEPPPNKPYPKNKYDAIAARKYFDGKWGLVLSRAIQVSYLSGTFLSALAVDYVTGNLDKNAEVRAQELSILLTKLGPSFIKIGQSLSIRTDLLSPAYVKGLKTLQDQVPAFDTNEARDIIENELGKPLSTIFETPFPNEPIAAASLGQVYKATTKDTKQEVAIKVQRPNIMNQIALDMHLIREVSGPIKRIFNLNTDFVGVVDTWGAGFVDELDYIEEAVNAKSFTESIEQTPLSGVVFAPPVVDELTTSKVLTSKWVVGERLDRSGKEDVSILCSIAMNSYLTMMLETGLLHCDPHPGNLLRTTDGKLCILDWGMVTRLDPDLQITLIEHMAHLTSADYDEVPKDLLLLGFINESNADVIKDSGVVETLAEIYGSWTAGGGAAAVNVNKVIADLQDLTAEKGNFFQIPPYFAYIAKSFSVLEGIGLSNDAKYSIINECLPYVSKRLLTDKSERTGGALSTFIFGPDKSNEDRIIDYDRVEQLVSGFGDYTTSASGELLGKNSTRAETVENVAEQVLDLLATEEETPLQEIFIEQLAKIITSSTRSAWSDLRERSGKLPTGRTVLGTLVDPLGVFRTSPIVRVNELDERTVETTRNLIELLASTSSQSADSNVDISDLTSAEIVEISSIIAQKLFDRRSAVVKTSNRLAMQLLELTATRLEKGGDRDIVVVPSSDPLMTVSDERIHEESRPTVEKGEDSDRLAGARKILSTIEFKK